MCRAQEEKNHSLHKYGEKIKYDRLWEGPIQKRQQTDVTFLILFVIFLITWITIGFYASWTADQKIVDDDYWKKHMIPIFISLSAVVSLSYIALLRWFAKFTVYTTIFIFWCLLFGIFCKLSYDHVASHIINLRNLRSIICIAVFTIATGLILLFNRKILDGACETVKESCKVLMFFPSSLILFPWILVVAFYGICFWTYLAYENLSANPNFLQNNGLDYIIIFHLINFFGCFWLVSFVRALARMILSGSFATWYWTRTKDNVPTYTVIRCCGVAVRYHLGTVAFGSLVLTICRLVEIFLRFLQYGIEDRCYCILESFSMLLKGLRTFLDYLSHNAYIMSAIHGTGLIQSSRDAFNLLMRNIHQVVITTYVRNVIILLGQLLAIGIPVLAMWIYCSIQGINNEMTDAIKYVAFGSLLISECHFIVLRSAINTILLCVVEDFERNDDSDEKPYYMPLKMKKIFFQ